MDIGSELRTARLRRQLTIEQVAKLTKIRPSLLQAIERNDFHQLPGALYAKGFLKSYAREVGLKPDEIVAEYVRMTALPAESAPAPAAVRPVGGPAWQLSPLLTRWRAIAGVFVLAWFVASYLAHQRANVATSSNADQVASAASGPPVVDDRSTGTSGGSPSSSPRPMTDQADSIRLEVQITGPCWVAADTDGERVINRLMTAGERETIHARDAITVRVGDPSAFKFRINGQPGRSLGAPGQAVTIRITRENYASFAGSGG